MDDDDRKKGRTRLPVEQAEKNGANFWKFLKQCVGKELTEITMPVAWNEPLSLLQRIAEYVDYGYLLKAASEREDPVTRMKLVAAFSVSALASNAERLGKPFNPLLGETYALDKGDCRILCEQVGHHPPVSAFTAENAGGDFVFCGSVSPKVKFWGKSVEFRPKGTLGVTFPKRDETYTWSNVNCLVHNIIVGSLWLEHAGTVEIVNRSTLHKTALTFKPAGWFSEAGNLHNVVGFISDADKNKLFFLYGKWTEFLCCVDVEAFEGFYKVKAAKIDPAASNLPKRASPEMGEIPGSSILWSANPRPENSASFYNFSELAMTLNEFREGVSYYPTDCRYRPDIRALENGRLDEAASEKDRLEKKQREYRKRFNGQKEQEWWTPKWFVPSKNDDAKDVGLCDWTYAGGYWESHQRSIDIPDIY